MIDLIEKLWTLLIQPLLVLVLDAEIPTELPMHHFCSSQSAGLVPQTPGRHFTPVEKAILIAKQLGDFIHLYNRETLEHVAPRESPALLDPQLHKQFVTGAR